jgi:hypothetical protein
MNAFIFYLNLLSVQFIGIAQKEWRETIQSSTIMSVKELLDNGRIDDARKELESLLHQEICHPECLQLYGDILLRYGLPNERDNSLYYCQEVRWFCFVILSLLTTSNCSLFL